MEGIYWHISHIAKETRWDIRSFGRTSRERCCCRKGSGWKRAGEKEQNSLKSGVFVRKMMDLEQTKVCVRTCAAPGKTARRINVYFIKNLIVPSPFSRRRAPNAVGKVCVTLRQVWLLQVPSPGFSGGCLCRKNSINMDIFNSWHHNPFLPPTLEDVVKHIMKFAGKSSVVMY